MIEVYCDESRPELLSLNKDGNSKDRYMVIGGLWVPYPLRERFKDEIKRIRQHHEVFGEIKWKNVSPSKIYFYHDLIRLFFRFEGIRFRCIVVDSFDVDLEKFHESDSELGFYKFYYQLLKHWVDDYREHYWIYLDYKKNKVSDRLKTLKRVLNNSSLGNVEDVQAIDSKQSLIIQMSDLLIGAVGYKYNGYFSSEAKLSLINLIENEFGCSIKKTLKSSYKFNIFEIDLSIRKYY